MQGKECLKAKDIQCRYRHLCADYFDFTLELPVNLKQIRIDRLNAHKQKNSNIYTWWNLCH